MVRWSVAAIFCGACTLIGDTGEKVYVHDTTSPPTSSGSGGDACAGGCQGTVAACSGPACIDGACDILFAPTGTPCTGQPGFCDGAGFCAECSQSTHCDAGEACLDFACFAGGCRDGMQNGSETAIDCGGVCPPCGLGELCDLHSDCRSRNCVAGVCTGCHTRECGEGAFCNFEGECEPQKPEGATCTDDFECQSGLECDVRDFECVEE
jgi:hypothetical protein